MQTNDKDFTQKERIANLLVEINKDVTESDRASFMDEKKISRVSLSRYMNGKVRNVDLALEMLLFFQKKIADRENLIHS